MTFPARRTLPQNADGREPRHRGSPVRLFHKRPLGRSWRRSGGQPASDRTVASVAKAMELMLMVIFGVR
jgi:hypothetical protein